MFLNKCATPFCATNPYVVLFIAFPNCIYRLYKIIEFICSVLPSKVNHLKDLPAINLPLSSAVETPKYLIQLLLVQK